MLRVSHLAGVAAAAFIGCAGMADVVGPEWVEDDTGEDAGSLPGTAQVITGQGTTIARVTGQLGGPAGGLAGAGDFEDMYCVNIINPNAFSLKTFGDGFADFDTQLWVFDSNGLGVLGNDNAPDQGTASGLGQFSNDGTESGIFEPGLYYICISGGGNRPLSPFGDIFFFSESNEVSGPDGEGGGDPVNGWDPKGAFGNYSMDVGGVVSILPAPGGLALFGLAPILGMRRSRRR